MIQMNVSIKKSGMCSDGLYDVETGEGTGSVENIFDRECGEKSDTSCHLWLKVI
jgi:hypothetical protein